MHRRPVFSRPAETPAINSLVPVQPSHSDWSQFTQPVQVPGPVGLEEGRVVDDGGQQSGEGPEQQRGEELGDDGVLMGAETSEKSRSSRLEEEEEGEEEEKESAGVQSVR